MVTRKLRQGKVFHSEREVESLGEQFARQVLRRYGLRSTAYVLGLVGELGAGKTTFIRGFARGLGIRRRVASPTFVIARRYQTPSHKRVVLRHYGVMALRPRYFWHLDAYRLRSAKDLEAIDSKALFHDPGAVVAVEWADRVKAAIPKNATWISFRHHPRGRIVTITNGKERMANNA